MKIKFISYFTPRYKESAQRLIRSMDKFGLDFHVEELPEFSDKPGEKFQMAVRAKPQFIYDMMKKFANYDAVCWTDADSEFKLPPKLLFTLDCDLAVRYRECFEMLSGTMLWRVCYKNIQFLPHWINSMHDPSTFNLPCPEQQVLTEMVKTSGLDVYRLPEEYVYIAPMKDKPADMLREQNNAAREVDPVIYHYQASRQTRTT